MKFGQQEDYLWYDHRLTGNEELNEGIRAALQASEFLLAVISPGFLKSDWCPRELTEFLASSRRNGRDLPGRIFRIMKEEVSLGSLQAPLQNARGYKFFERSGERNQLFYSSSEKYRDKYWDVIEDIAHDFHE